MKVNTLLPLNILFFLAGCSFKVCSLKKKGGGRGGSLLNAFHLSKFESVGQFAAPVIKPQIPVKDFVGREGDFLF